MAEYNKRLERSIGLLSKFRGKIPAGLDRDKIKKIWDIDVDTFSKIPSYKSSEILLKRKLGIVEYSLDWIVIKPLVKFVGVSGSVASEFAKDDDDIDLFIVTKNDTVWIVRAFIYLRDIKKKKIRKKDKNFIEDKLCLNLFVEERALEFKSDIFNLNELLFLKPIYNKEYIENIYSANLWLRNKYFVSGEFFTKKDVRNLKKRNYLLIPFNILAFLAQLLFMILRKHEPDLKRLFNNFKKGRIQFYPKDFRDEKLKEFRGY